jgi:hypothetical protein
MSKPLYDIQGKRIRVGSLVAVSGLLGQEVGRVKSLEAPYLGPLSVAFCTGLSQGIWPNECVVLEEPVWPNK